METDNAMTNLDAPFAVLRAGRESSLVARRPIARDASILVLEGAVTDRPSLGSVQIDDDRHVEVPVGWDYQRMLDECPWRFLNHSCEPNAAFRGLELVAIRSIAPGESITFDYDTTEWEIAAPFRCHCGGRDCHRSLVRGFKHLTPAERLRRLPNLADHLRRRVDATTGELH
ncbi:MAG: SET domain-containing protein-lysine N-methyltransferase [Planctomycetes bacterium]|nr:SET domain-containing protein-lysine N-methyltransferase [Planctomycetota bacterium]